MTQYRLYTNLADVSLIKPAAVQFHCHALLLEYPLVGPPSRAELGQCGQVRGFYTDSALPIFTYRLDCGPFECELEAVESRHIFIGENGKPRPLSSGHLLTFKDGARFSLMLNDVEAGLQTRDYETDEIKTVWRDLQRDVLRTWTAPNIAVSCYVPRDRAPEFWR